MQYKLLREKELNKEVSMASHKVKWVDTLGESEDPTVKVVNQNIEKWLAVKKEKEREALDEYAEKVADESMTAKNKAN